MASVTLDDVRIAFYQEKDHRRAAEMLQVVLRQAPSADAWYIAAQMTQDEDKAIKYLRQALLLNPNHKLAKRMLERLGGTEAGLIKTLSSETVDTISNYSGHIPVVKNLRPYQQLIIAGIIFLFAGIVLIMTLQSVITHTQQVAAPVELPEPTPVVMVTPQQIIDRFNAESIVLYNMRLIQEEAAQNLRFNIADSTGATYGVSIWVYDSVSAFIADETRINMQTATANVIGATNAFLIYPHALPDPVAQQLEQVFRSTAGL